MGTAPFGFPVMRDLKERDRINLKGVFTQPDRKKGRGQKTSSPPVAEFARELDIPLYQPADINDEGLDQLETLGGLDLIFVIAYGQFLSEEVFGIPRIGCFNFHASLLPRWRGAAPIRHTLLHGDERTGVTVFQLDEDMDTGPVCIQKPTPVESNENYGELYERLSQLNVRVLDELLKQIENDSLQCEPQRGEPTYAPQISKEDTRIQWDQSVRQIRDRVRAFSPEPGSFTMLGDDRYKIYAVDIEKTTTDLTPGTIVQCSNKTLSVVGLDGLVHLKEIQPAGSDKMSVEAFLAGQPDLEEGNRFQ